MSRLLSTVILSLLSSFGYKQQIKLKGSIAICISTPNGIFLAADSKLVSLNNSDSIFNYSGRTCKIKINNDIVFACTGYLKSLSPNISIQDIVSKCLIKGASFKSDIIIIKDKLYPQNLELANSMYQLNPNNFRNKILNNVFNSILIASVRNGKHYIGYITFTPKINFQNKIYLDTITNFTNAPLTELKIGEYKEVNSFIDSHPNYYKNQKDEIEYLTNLIRIQSKTTPNFVNDTINMIKIDNNGSIKWVVRNQECLR